MGAATWKRPGAFSMKWQVVRERGFEPLRVAPLDPKTENRIFSNPSIVVRFSRNLAENQENLIYIYSSLFYLFQSF
jgi:hypothetical protein